MRSRDVRATTAGLLFIAATATSLVATAFRGSLLNGPNFLAAVCIRTCCWRRCWSACPASSRPAPRTRAG